MGLSIATLLAQHNEVTAVDIIPEKVDLINHRKSPIIDKEIEEYLATKDLHLQATLDAKTAYKDAEFVVIAAPTNYDSQKNYFDTSAVDSHPVGIAVQSRCHHGHQINHSSGIHQERPSKIQYSEHHLLSRVPSRKSCPLRQPLPFPHHCRNRHEGRASCFCSQDFCTAIARRSHQGEHRHTLHGIHRG